MNDVGVDIQEAKELFRRAEALLGHSEGIPLTQCQRFFSEAKTLLEEAKVADLTRTPSVLEAREFVSRARELVPSEPEPLQVEEQFNQFCGKAQELVAKDLEPKIRALADYTEEVAANFEDMNVLGIFGIARKETPHSRFLAWLLDPCQNHGLKAAFFRKFIKEAQKLHGKDFEFDELQVEVETEKGTEHGVPDITIWGSHPEPFLVIIENKIMAGEGRDQTPRYVKAAKGSGIPEPRLLLLFLTPKGRAPKSPKFKPMSYDLVLKILDDTLKLQMPQRTRFLIRQFAFNLRYSVLGRFNDYLRAKRLGTLLESLSGTAKIRTAVDRYEELDRLYRVIQGGEHGTFQRFQ